MAKPMTISGLIETLQATRLSLSQLANTQEEPDNLHEQIAQLDEQISALEAQRNAVNDGY
jgi:cell division protein FtsB